MSHLNTEMSYSAYGAKSSVWQLAMQSSGSNTDGIVDCYTFISTPLGYHN